MIPDTYKEVVSYLPFMKNMKAAGIRVYILLLNIAEAIGAKNEPFQLNLGKIRELLEYPPVTLSVTLRDLEELGFIKLAGKAERKTVTIVPPKVELLKAAKLMAESLQGWSSEEVVKVTRTYPAKLRAGTLAVIDHWNNLLVKPRTTPPALNQDGTYECLSTHVVIDKLIQKLHQDNFTPAQIKDAIRLYANDPLVPEAIRKKFSLANFLENKFTRIVPPSLCRVYLQGKSPFFRPKVKTIERPELLAPGLFNSLKSKFIMAYLGGRPEALSEYRETQLVIGANNISAAIKSWAPLLKRKLNSSEWAEYAHQCIENREKWHHKKGMAAHDPFTTLTQKWFATEAFPMFLSRPPACLLDGFQHNPVNPKEAGQVAAG